MWNVGKSSQFTNQTNLKVVQHGKMYTKIIYNKNSRFHAQTKMIVLDSLLQFHATLYKVVTTIICETCYTALDLFQSKQEIQSLDKFTRFFMYFSQFTSLMLLAWSWGVMGTR